MVKKKKKKKPAQTTGEERISKLEEKPRRITYNGDRNKRCWNEKEITLNLYLYIKRD